MLAFSKSTTSPAMSTTTDSSPQSSETSRDELLANFLTDEALADLVLVGTDGVQVRANRFLLAAKSEVFHRMLLGGFAEASKDVVEIGCKGSALKAIVEYILTDTAEILKHVKYSDTWNMCTPNKTKRIQELVSLMGAAVYFNLPNLCDLARKALAQSVTQDLSLAFVLLEAYHCEGPGLPTLRQLGVPGLFSHCAKALNSNAVGDLSAPVLEEILKDDQIEMDEFQLFEILCLWSNVDPPSGSISNRDTDRRGVAADMVKHIHLEWIDTKLLSTSVASSGLVSPEQLAQAYKSQALAAQERDPNAFKRDRWPSQATTRASNDYASAYMIRKDNHCIRKNRASQNKRRSFVKKPQLSIAARAQNLLCCSDKPFG